MVRRQRTILGIVIREVQRKLGMPEFTVDQPKAASDLTMWLERAKRSRTRTRQRNDKNKLCALAPEVACIGKRKARKPYEFGVKSAVVVWHQHGLMLGARTFPGNPYDGHSLSKHDIHRGRYETMTPQQKGLAAQAPSGRVGHRALEVRSPHGSLLAARRAG